MSKSIDDGLVKACSLVGELSVAIRLHDELCSLYAKRNLIKGLIGVFSQLPQPDCCLDNVSFDEIVVRSLYVLPI